MTETLTGKQVLALYGEDEVPEIEFYSHESESWTIFHHRAWDVGGLRDTTAKFRIKPTPARRLSVTLANGEVVSWPEPVREALGKCQEYWLVGFTYEPLMQVFEDQPIEHVWISTGLCHLTREAAQEHADALRKINTQEAK